MLPRALCQRSVRWVEGAWVVNYLTERDHGWLAALVAEYTGCRGLPHQQLKERLAPLPLNAPKGKRRIAEHLLDRLCRETQDSALPAREARQVLFSLAARQSGHPNALLEEAAAALRVDAAALDAALFADLDSARRVGELSPLLTPAALAQQANLAIVESLFARARELRIVAPDHAHALVRHARRAGLLCVISSRAEGAPAASLCLQISGPFALFRQTRVYGHALASLVRRTLIAPAFEITADCQLNPRGDPITLSVGAQAPIARSAESAPAESPSARCFARDFQRLTRKWQLVPDPEPVATGLQLVFADFEIRRRGPNAPRWLIEVVGFWTREYLLEKLARLRRAGLDRVLLCVDVQRGVSDGDLPECPELLPFRRRIDARAVLARVAAAGG